MNPLFASRIGERTHGGRTHEHTRGTVKSSLDTRTLRRHGNPACPDKGLASRCTFSSMALRVGRACGFIGLSFIGSGEDSVKKKALSCRGVSSGSFSAKAPGGLAAGFFSSSGPHDWVTTEPVASWQGSCSFEGRGTLVTATCATLAVPHAGSSCGGEERTKTDEK